MSENRVSRRRHRHDPTKSLVGFVVADVRYAVPIARVKEVTNPMVIVPVPHAPGGVVGVADFRGSVVPVIDMRTRFGLPAAEQTLKSKWIVCDVAGRLAALRVDAVTEVFGTDGADLRPTPALGSGGDTRGFLGVTTHAGGLVFVIDTARLRDLTEPLAPEMGHIAPASRWPRGASQ